MEPLFRVCEHSTRWQNERKMGMKNENQKVFRFEKRKDTKSKNYETGVYIEEVTKVFG